MTANSLRGIHVFWMIAAFFAVVIGVDAFFIVRAVGTFPGEQVRNSYFLGLDYNREIESRTRQAELGWNAQAGIQVGDDPVLIVRLADEARAPVQNLSVSASYHVIGEGREDHELELVEARPGEYRAPVVLESNKRIELNLTARRAGDGEAIFRASKTLVTP